MTEVLPEKNSFPDRVKQLVKMIGGREKLGQAIGVSSVMIGKYESGSEPSRDKLLALSEATGVSIEWLVSGRGPMNQADIMFTSEHGTRYVAEFKQTSQGSLDSNIEDGDFVLVPRYEVQASAGAGSLVQSEQIVDYLSFKSEWVRKVMGLAVGELALINVKGDSMEPTLSSDDLILVDLRAQEIHENAVYVLRLNGTLLVKRIQRKLDGTVIVKGDNPIYEPEILQNEAAGMLNVIGRVVWCGRKM